MASPGAASPHHPHPPKMPHRRNFRSESWTLALRMIFAFRNTHVSDPIATPIALNRIGKLQLLRMLRQKLGG